MANTTSLKQPEINIEGCLVLIDESRITECCVVYISRTPDAMELVFEYSEAVNDFIRLLEIRSSDYAQNDSLWEEFKAAARFISEKYAAKVIEDDVLGWIRANT
ncbi:MAG: hypothetical protein ACI4TK_07705 [Agathobacter sp.]